jgi:hypothetical protein
MEEVVTIKKTVKFLPRVGSKYEVQEVCDDGIHIKYLEIDKNLMGHTHIVKLTQRKGWDELVKLYPIK